VYRTEPTVRFTDEERDKLTVRIQEGGTEVVKAKGNGSATLAMAWAGAQFAFSLIRALSGEKGVVECTMVDTGNSGPCQYFALPVELGPDGVKQIHPLGKLSSYEQGKLEKDVIPELKSSIQKGIEWAKQQK